MDHDEAWQIIEGARKGLFGSKSGETILPKLMKSLSNLSDEDLYAWWNWLDERAAEANDWNLWGAAYLIMSGCSDDGFEYFRYWLVSAGRRTFTTAVENPDSLADLRLGRYPELECESLAYVVCDILEQRGAEDAFEEMSRRYPRGEGETRGEEFDEERLKKILPRLTEKYGTIA